MFKFGRAKPAGTRTRPVPARKETNGNRKAGGPRLATQAASRPSYLVVSRNADRQPHSAELTAVHVSIHRRAGGVPYGAPRTLAGRQVRPLAPAPGHFAELFDVTWEQVSAALTALPSLDIEPDGAFSWSVPAALGPGPIDGQLYEHRERLWRVEIKGPLGPRSLDALLAAAGWPDVPVMLQLVPQGIVLDEVAFRHVLG